MNLCIFAFFFKTKNVEEKYGAQWVVRYFEFGGEESREFFLTVETVFENILKKKKIFQITLIRYFSSRIWTHSHHILQHTRIIEPIILCKFQTKTGQSCSNEENETITSLNYQIDLGSVHKIRAQFSKIFDPFVTQNRTNPYIFTVVRNKSLTPHP